jgi:hypothetical protein
MAHTFAEFGLDRPWIAVVPSFVTRVGVMPVTVLAERKNALTAAMSCVSLSLTSTRD